MIMKCECKHSYQDSIYGKGNRVFNKTEKGENGPIVYRCTVCKAEKTK